MEDLEKLNIKRANSVPEQINGRLQVNYDGLSGHY